VAEAKQGLPVKLPLPLYQQLRRLAYESRRSMNQIVIDAVSDAIKRELGDKGPVMTAVARQQDKPTITGTGVLSATAEIKERSDENR
jgi:hypothetical protein